MSTSDPTVLEDSSLDPSPRTPPSPEVGSPFVRVIAWAEAVAPSRSFAVRSRYAERFWLPVLGPSTLWFLRRLVDGLEAAPKGYLLPLETTARSLGLGGAGGRHSPFRRAIQRAARFGALRILEDEGLAVRRRLPVLPDHLATRLPAALRAEHGQWTVPPEAGAAVAGARRLALELVGVLGDAEELEAHLHACGCHPALAYRAAEWAVGAHQRLRWTTSS